MLRIASVAGIVATIHDQAAKYPHKSPYMYDKYGWMPPSPGNAVPSSAMVNAPVHARIPPRSHMSNEAPGDGTLASMGPGEEKTPEPITMLIRRAKPSTARRLRAKVP